MKHLFMIALFSLGPLALADAPVGGKLIIRGDNIASEYYGNAREWDDEFENWDVVGDISDLNRQTRQRSEMRKKLLDKCNELSAPIIEKKKEALEAKGIKVDALFVKRRYGSINREKVNGKEVKYDIKGMYKKYLELEARYLRNQKKKKQ